MNKRIKQLLTAGILTVGIALTAKTADAATLYSTTANLNYRKGPGTNYTKIGTLPSGSKIQVENISNGWAKLSNGYYVSSSYIRKASDIISATNKYLYTTNSLNLRKGPSTGYSKIVTMPANSRVVCMSQSNGWCKVNYQGYIGWCSSQYLTSKQTINNEAIFINKIKVNKSTHKIYCYSNNKLIRVMSCAIGKPSTPTPSGTFRVINMQKNRPYYKKNIPGGAPNNPLGPRFIQLTSSGYAIHGNCNSYSIGKSASDGCVRLYNSDVIWLYDRVAVGKTTVVIY